MADKIFHWAEIKLFWDRAVSPTKQHFNEGEQWGCYNSSFAGSKESGPDPEVRYNSSRYIPIVSHYIPIISQLYPYFSTISYYFGWLKSWVFPCFTYGLLNYIESQ